MALNSLTARANTGAGTDTLAGQNTAAGFAGAVVGTDGTNFERLASETTLATLLTTTAFNARTPAFGQAAMAASSPVVIASDQSTIPVNQAGVSATGTLAALNATVALSLNGATGFAVDLRGTFTATVTFQGTINGTDWFTLAVIPAGSGVNVASVTTATAAGAWIGNANGMVQVRANATAYTSGTITVTMRAMLAAGMVTNLPAGATTQAVAVTGYPTAAASADGLANPTVTKIDATNLLHNGTTWDRQRGNTSVSVEASSAKTASGNSAAAITNHNARGVVLFVNVSAASGTTPTLAVRVQVQDPVSSTWVDVPGAVTPSITTTGITMLAIYPGATVAANAAVSYPLPRTWRLAWTIGGTTPSFTFSVGAQYVL